MYEDAEIERDAFRGRGRVFCIASAGCTAMRLCVDHEVVACDINPVQLAYAERRVRGEAPREGDVERVMALARAFMPLVGWRRGAIRSFLALSDTSEQVKFWQARLNTRRFRAGFDALMSPVLLRAVYAAPLLASLPARFGPVLRKRLERGFGLHANATNPYAAALLLGVMNNEACSQTAGIQFVAGDAATSLESRAAGSFDAFSLSNILDGAESAYRARLSRAVRRAAGPNAVVVLRSFAEPPPEQTVNLADRDRAMLWGSVQVSEARLF
jgi:S-adenosylmethionine:diacylglycerol 3-amino-3-carboxypropyl transferase